MPTLHIAFIVFHSALRRRYVLKQQLNMFCQNCYFGPAYTIALDRTGQASRTACRSCMARMMDRNIHPFFYVEVWDGPQDIYFFWLGTAELDQWISQEETSAALAVQRVENARSLQELHPDRIETQAMPEILSRNRGIRLGRFATRERRRRALILSVQPRIAASE